MNKKTDKNDTYVEKNRQMKIHITHQRLNHCKRRIYIQADKFGSARSKQDAKL